MSKLNLRSRLFLSHLLVMIVGLTTFIILAKLSSPSIFILSLERLERNRVISLRAARTHLMEGFESAWNRGAFWSLIIGATAAGAFSYWATQNIVKPLNEMKTITRKFAAGNLEERLPESDIPEFNQLGNSFNRMASSLEGVENRRRELISDLTHELRTPLTVVRGYLEELADGKIEASPELYERLVKETKRLERLTHDLQELSKAEAGYLSIDMKPVNIEILLESLMEKFIDQLLEDGPELKLTLEDNLPLVMADIDRTEQIFVNLLGNAIRYTEKGYIQISAWRENEIVWFSVKDTGIGIASKDLPYIFERFWRADKSRSSCSGGTGIGLAIVRRLVESQGGHIEVTSELDVGSTFRFYLKVA